jgi:hypothetical protein
MAFDANREQLQEIKNRLTLSDVVGRTFKLVKRGSEYVVADNPSFTVNNSKQIWKDFGNGGEKAGDVFDFVERYAGLTKVAAIETLAQEAGVVLRSRPGRSTSSTGSSGKSQGRKSGNGASEHFDAPREDRPQSGDGAQASPPDGKLEIVQVWDIKAPDNSVLYQTVRFQKRLADGSWAVNKNGKIFKKPSQRRPSPDNDGTFVWALDFIDRKTGQPFEFLRWRKDGDWVRADDEKKATGGYELRTFEAAGNVDHWLYNANDVIDEIQEPPEDQRIVFLPEGEGNVDVLKEWGLLAVSNTGGAGNFSTDMAEFFRGAADVVILEDNDPPHPKTGKRAGAERTAKVAPMLKDRGCNVRVLNFKTIWPSCPERGDVKDWRDGAAGDRARLLEIVDSLKPWVPEPYKSRYGAKTARDLNAPARQFPWRIKFLVPRNIDTLIMGPTKSGKTFETLNMCMHVHFGKDYGGRRVEAGGIVYLTYEGSEGFENRLRAYMQYHGLTHADLHSFAWLTRPPGLYASEDDAKGVAAEIVEISRNFKLPLSHSVIDTHNAATRGSSEIKSEDVARIQTNYSAVRDGTTCPLWIVGHTNQEGRHRGNEQFFNGIDVALLIKRSYSDEKKQVERRDDEGRVVRRISTDKVRDGDDTLRFDFVLHRVVIGVDEDGDDISSMVSVDPVSATAAAEAGASNRKDRPEGFALTVNHAAVFQALLSAIDEMGTPPPAALKLPQSVTRVVQWADLGNEYKKSDPQELDETKEQYRNRIKARTRRFREDLRPYRVIGVASMVDPTDTDPKPRMLHYVWPTGKRVYGKGLQWPPIARAKPAAKPILAPGETEDDFGGPPRSVF